MKTDYINKPTNYVVGQHVVLKTIYSHKVSTVKIKKFWKIAHVRGEGKRCILSLLVDNSNPRGGVIQMFGYQCRKASIEDVLFEQAVHL